ERTDLFTHIIAAVLKIRRSEPYKLCYGLHFIDTEAPGRNGRRTDTDTAGNGRLLRISRDSVFVYGNIHLVKSVLQLLAGDIKRAKVHEHEMVVGATGNEVKSLFTQLCCQARGVFDHTALIITEFRFQCFTKAGSLGGYDMHERSALRAGEYSLVYL